MTCILVSVNGSRSRSQSVERQRRGQPARSTRGLRARGRAAGRGDRRHARRLRPRCVPRDGPPHAPPRPGRAGAGVVEALAGGRRGSASSGVPDPRSAPPPRGVRRPPVVRDRAAPAGPAAAVLVPARGTGSDPRSRSAASRATSGGGPWTASTPPPARRLHPRQDGSLLCDPRPRGVPRAAWRHDPRAVAEGVPQTHRTAASGGCGRDPAPASPRGLGRHRGPRAAAHGDGWGALARRGGRARGALRGPARTASGRRVLPPALSRRGPGGGARPAPRLATSDRISDGGRPARAARRGRSRR